MECIVAAWCTDLGVKIAAAYNTSRAAQKKATDLGKDPHTDPAVRAAARACDELTKNWRAVWPELVFLEEVAKTPCWRDPMPTDTSRDKGHTT